PPTLVETLSDDREIAILRAPLEAGETTDPLRPIHEHREQERREDEEFGDYVEKLLSQPFVRPEILEHGVRWFRSKNRIEEFRRSEAQAASIIAEYAFEAFLREPDRTDFILSGPSTQIRVRVFVLRDVSQ